MIKNYFKIGWRNLLRNKGYSFINISGLAMGMAVAMLISLWVFDELSFNQSFPNYRRIAKVYHHLTFGDNILTLDDVPQPFGNELKNNYADFEEVTLTEQEDHIIGYEEKTFSKTVLFVEPQFATMFSLHILQGSSVSLKDVHSIMICKSLARDILGDNAMGKMLKFDDLDNLMVTGVFEDFPSNSQFAEVKMLLPMNYYFTTSESARKKMNNWEVYYFQCYVLLHEKATFLQAETKIKNVLFQKVSGDGKAIKPVGILIPMEKWHLYSEFKDGKNISGKIQFVWMFGIIGVFVLLLACINFMNLSTARSENRSKEVGIRKVMGSARNQLVSQFLSESTLVVIIAFFMATAIGVLCLPWFNDLANKKMTIPWSNSYFLLLSAAFVIITSVLAGSYPALYLSSFNPVKVLKGTFKAERFAGIPRKIMVVFQFTISTTLIIGTIVVFKQINKRSVIDAVLNVAGYTYGPLLGLFTFGIFTKRQVRDKLVPVVCVLSPMLSYVVSSNSEVWFGGYKFGLEILVLNGLITFGGLWVVSREGERAL